MGLCESNVDVEFEGWQKGGVKCKEHDVDACPNCIAKYPKVPKVRPPAVGVGISGPSVGVGAGGVSVSGPEAKVSV